MQCQAVIENDGCPNIAITGENFCPNHFGVGKTRQTQYSPDEHAFRHTDKFTKDQLGYIKHLGDKPKKIVPKTTKSILEPEVPVEREQVHLQDIMTMGEVAEYLSVSKMTLKRWDKLGKLKAIRINSRGDRRYLRSEIERITGGTHD